MTDLAQTPTAHDLADRTGYDPEFLGVTFTRPPTARGSVTTTVLDGTC